MLASSNAPRAGGRASKRGSDHVRTRVWRRLSMDKELVGLGASAQNSQRGSAGGHHGSSHQHHHHHGDISSSEIISALQNKLVFNNLPKPSVVSAWRPLLTLLSDSAKRHGLLKVMPMDPVGLLLAMKKHRRVSDHTRRLMLTHGHTLASTIYVEPSDPDARSNPNIDADPAATLTPRAPTPPGDGPVGEGRPIPGFVSSAGKPTQQSSSNSVREEFMSKGNGETSSSVQHSAGGVDVEMARTKRGAAACAPAGSMLPSLEDRVDLLGELVVATNYSRAAYGFVMAAGHMGSLSKMVRMVGSSAFFDPVTGASVDSNNEAIESLTGIPKADILFAEWRNTAFRPCHFLAVDRVRRRLVLSIRGSLELGDICTDMTAHPVPWEFKGHSLGAGVAALVALMLRQRQEEPHHCSTSAHPSTTTHPPASPQQAQPPPQTSHDLLHQSTIEPELPQPPPVKAPSPSPKSSTPAKPSPSLPSMHPMSDMHVPSPDEAPTLPVNTEICCICIAPPAVFTAELADHCRPFIYCVVNDMDFVPRLSHLSVELALMDVVSCSPAVQIAGNITSTWGALKEGLAGVRDGLAILGSATNITQLGRSQRVASGIERSRLGEENSEVRGGGSDLLGWSSSGDRNIALAAVRLGEENNEVRGGGSDLLGWSSSIELSRLGEENNEVRGGGSDLLGWSSSGDRNIALAAVRLGEENNEVRGGGSDLLGWSSSGDRNIALAAEREAEVELSPLPRTPGAGSLAQGGAEAKPPALQQPGIEVIASRKPTPGSRSAWVMAGSSGSGFISPGLPGHPTASTSDAVATATITTSTTATALLTTPSSDTLALETTTATIITTTTAAAVGSSSLVGSTGGDRRRSDPRHPSYHPPAPRPPHLGDRREGPALTLLRRHSDPMGTGSRELITDVSILPGEEPLLSWQGMKDALLGAWFGNGFESGSRSQSESSPHLSTRTSRSHSLPQIGASSDMGKEAALLPGLPMQTNVQAGSDGRTAAGRYTADGSKGSGGNSFAQIGITGAQGGGGAEANIGLGPHTSAGAGGSAPGSAPVAGSAPAGDSGGGAHSGEEAMGGEEDGGLLNCWTGMIDAASTDLMTAINSQPAVQWQQRFLREREAAARIRCNSAKNPPPGTLPQSAEVEVEHSPPPKMYPPGRILWMVYEEGLGDEDEDFPSNEPGPEAAGGDGGSAGGEEQLVGFKGQKGGRQGSTGKQVGQEDEDRDSDGADLDELSMVAMESSAPIMSPARSPQANVSSPSVGGTNSLFDIISPTRLIPSRPTQERVGASTVATAGAGAAQQAGGTASDFDTRGALGEFNSGLPSISQRFAASFQKLRSGVDQFLAPLVSPESSGFGSGAVEQGYVVIGEAANIKIQPLLAVAGAGSDGMQCARSQADCGLLTSQAPPLLTSEQQEAMAQRPPSSGADRVGGEGEASQGPPCSSSECKTSNPPQLLDPKAAKAVESSPLMPGALGHGMRAAMGDPNKGRTGEVSSSQGGDPQVAWARANPRGASTSGRVEPFHLEAPTRAKRATGQPGPAQGQGNGKRRLIMVEADKDCFQLLALVPSFASDHLPDAYYDALVQLEKAARRKMARSASITR
eukprot:gene6435-3064_t